MADALEHALQQGEFQRPILQFEREFGTHRNWWVRDHRIAGLPLSILLYVLSHQQDFVVTQTSARADLKLSKEAFLKARRKLEATGFLRAEDYRLPKGAVDEAGNKVGGHRRVRFIVLDPQQPKDLSSAPSLQSSSADVDMSPVREGADPSANMATAADPACGQPSAHFAPRLSPDSDPPVDNSQLPHDSGEEAWTQKPGQAFAALKENHFQENQPVNHHPDGTISPVEAGGPAMPGSVVVFDPVTDAVLAGITPPVDAVRLRDKLVAGQANLAAVNIAAAAVEVLAAPPANLRDAVAYLAGPILRSPERWPRAATVPASAPIRCEAEGHKVFADGTDLCAKCEQVQTGAAARPGARFERGFIHLPATAVSA